MAANNNLDLIVNQKSSFRAVFNVKNSDGTPVNLGGYTVAAGFKADISAADSTQVDFTSAITDSANGEITISLTKEQTNAMKNPRYVYDVVITETSSGFRTRLIEGAVKVAAGVTPVTD